MAALDRRGFRRAAHTSVIPAGGNPRPGIGEVRAAEYAAAILDAYVARSLRTQWVDAIVAAVCLDIVAARRHG